MAKVETLSCPVCNGQVDFEEGAQRGRCLSCQASLALPMPMGYYHYYMAPQIKRNTALTIAAMATELAVENIAAHLYFVPAWSAKTETFAFIAGQRPIRETVTMEADDLLTGGQRAPDGFNPWIAKTGGEVVKKSLWLRQEFREFGVRWSNLSGLKISAILERPQLPMTEGSPADQGIRLEPRDLPPEKALTAAGDFFSGNILFPYGSYPILQSAVANLRIDRRLVYYPVWSCWGFTKLGRFKCTVDAVTGDRGSSWQYRKAKPEPPTKYLLTALVLILALSMIYAPTTGYSSTIFIGTLVMAAAAVAGVYIKKRVIDRAVEKACRAVYGM